MTVDPTDVYVVGTGMVGYRQLTKEAEAVLEKAERIYTVHHQELVREYFREEYPGTVIDLTGEYSKTETRDVTYERMARAVLDGAEEADDPVAFALYGHPTVFVSPSRWVIEEAPERGLEVETLPGVSSMDCLYADLPFDPARNGVQMFEATDLLVREWELNPEVPAMIWQIGTVESTYYPHRKSAPERFSRFREYLQQFYPDDHTVYVLQTAIHPIGKSKQIEFTLEEFESMHEEINPVQTLFVPPVRERPVQNEQLLEQIASQEHVENITLEEAYEHSSVAED